MHRKIKITSLANFQVICILLVLMMGSCSSKSGEEWSEFIDFGSDGMIPHREYLLYPFQNHLEDSIQKEATIYIGIRYTDNCKVKNLPLNVEYSSLLADTIRERQIDIPLFENQGGENANSHLGIYEKYVLLRPNLLIDSSQYFLLSTDTQDTKGIISIGITGQIKNSIE